MLSLWLSSMLLLVGSLALHPACVRLQQVRHAPTARWHQRPRPLLQPAAGMPRVPSTPSMVTPSELLELGLDCVGCVAGPSGTVVVVGTAHTPCKSEAEVCEVISRLKPDAVILELDQER